MVNICTSKNCVNLQHDFQMLRHERLKFNKNSRVGYLNITSLRNKIINLREIIRYLNLDYFVLNEPKIDSSFPSAQFAIDNYEIKAHCYSGGLIVYVCVISRRLKEYETPQSEAICSEITILMKQWLYNSTLRPPEAINLDSCYGELHASLSKACCKYENFVIMGDAIILMQNLRKTAIESWKNFV